MNATSKPLKRKSKLQFQAERVRDFCELLDSVYRDLGFTDYAVKLALRPDKRFGSDDMWDTAEAELREAVLSSNLSEDIKAKF